jgi:preprotein translocase SecE subunit
MAVQWGIIDTSESTFMVGFLIWENRVAEEKPVKKPKKTESLRQRAERAATTGDRPRTRRLRKTAGVASRPIRAAYHIGRKEYYLPLPDNRFWRFMNKRRRWTPGFIRNSWLEMRQVDWPNRRETFRLSVAVFIFSLIFGFIITVVDFGLDKVFKKVFLQ